MTEQNPIVVISIDFLKCLPSIPLNIQKKIADFIIKFKENPLSSSINYEKIQTFKDSNIRSVRIDLNYRGIILHPKTGNTFMLLWVDHHDKAYKWAENKVFKIHPETGGLQIIDTIQTVITNQIEQHTGLFDSFTDKQLKHLGVPEELISRVRTITTEQELDKATQWLPEEAIEGLYMLASGYSFEEALAEVGRIITDKKIDTENYRTALQNIDSKRRFYIVENEQELMEIINSPLELWRVFLHPSQRKIVEMDASGPVRVLGGAGTGKTVVAMHRAKWLAEKLFNKEEDRILFTTFTKNLSIDISENLKKICHTETLKRIEVINVDAWVNKMLKDHGYTYKIIFPKEADKLWDIAINKIDTQKTFTKAFYEKEWDMVIQTNEIETFENYLKTNRTNRGKKLKKEDKQLLWSVFTEYRNLLDESNQREMSDLCKECKRLIETKGIHPYSAIVIDEAQDISQQAYTVFRTLIPKGKNDMFITGDAHQRIYSRNVVLSKCGIDIRGRAKKLKINYRTTEETKRWAVSLLEGIQIDDLDDGIDTLKGYMSLMHGTSPQIMHFKTIEEETDYINQYIKELNEPLNTICLVTATNELVRRYEKYFTQKGIECYVLKRDIAEDRTINGLRLSTMHRVKGLEFEHIIIASANEGIIPYKISEETMDHVDIQENELKERALLHVAVTRAKRNVLITSYGQQSRFLQDKSL